MARAFRCKECGTGYSTTGNDIPTAINWYDNHKCKLVEVESKLGVFEPSRMNIEKMKSFNACSNHSNFSDEEELRETRMKHIGQNGNDGLHYEREEDDFNG